MLLTRTIHAFDEKMRLTIPAKLRKELQEEGGELILTRSAGSNLTLYTKSQWDVVVERIEALPQQRSAVRRFVVGNAEVVKFDSSGRILISQHLRDAANLTDKVAIVGMGKHVELWHADDWESAQSETIDQAILDSIF